MVNLKHLTDVGLSLQVRWYQRKAAVAYIDLVDALESISSHEIFKRDAIHAQKDQRENSTLARERLFELLRRQQKDARNTA